VSKNLKIDPEKYNWNAIAFLNKMKCYLQARTSAWTHADERQGDVPRPHETAKNRTVERIYIKSFDSKHKYCKFVKRKRTATRL